MQTQESTGQVRRSARSAGDKAARKVTRAVSDSLRKADARDDAAPVAARKSGSRRYGAGF